MTQIEITGVKRISNYVEITYKMRFVVPAIYGTGANPIQGLDKIVRSYSDNYSTEIIPVAGTVIVYNDSAPIDLSITLANAKSQLQSKYASIRASLDGLTLSPYDTMAGLSFDGTTWAATNLITDIPVSNNNGQSNLSVSATGAAAAAVTLTLPAVPTKFHNIAYLEIIIYSTAARTGSATPVIVTTTNFPSNNAFTFASAGGVGTVDRLILMPDLPIKSLLSNTATTIVCPATANVIWRINCFYTTNV